MTKLTLEELRAYYVEKFDRMSAAFEDGDGQHVAETITGVLAQLRADGYPDMADSIDRWFVATAMRRIADGVQTGEWTARVVAVSDGPPLSSPGVDPVAPEDPPTLGGAGMTWGGPGGGQDRTGLTESYGRRGR